MSDKPVVILHGYSDDAKSFDPLAAFLRGKGFAAQSIYLGDYITLEDKITVPDLAEAFESELGTSVPRGPKAFDLIVHSTGALVAREWLTRFYLEAGKACPIDHFLMLAPANFGSPLGAVGKTMLGRIVKGWHSDFQSGAQVLSGLEMGSPYTRGLALRDVLNGNSFYTPDICKTAVLVGSHPYGEGLRKLVDKNGGDGTVYVCTANLNTSFVRIAMRTAGTQPTIEISKSKNDIAFGVFPDRTHATITSPQAGDPGLGTMIVRFLQLDTTESYSTFRDDCATLTRTTLPDKPTEEIYHSYMNLAPRALDNLGFSIPDYFLEFYEKPQTPADITNVDDLMVQVHNDIIEEVHNYGGDASYRSLIFDLTDLKQLLIDSGKELMFSLSAAPLSKLIGYSCDQKNDIGEFPLNLQNTLFWRPNETLLIDVVVERRQGSPDAKAFQLRKSPLSG